MSFMFKRGVWVKDKITGLQGCIISRMDSLTGCNRYVVQPEVDKEGKFVDGCWVDEHCLEVDQSRQQLRLDRDTGQPPG